MSCLKPVRPCAMLWRYPEMSGYPWTFSHGPGQPDAIARELKYHGSCCDRYTMATERLWTTCWMVTDSAKKGRWRNCQGWIDSLQPWGFLATEVGIGRKIIIVVAFYVAAPQNKNEVTSRRSIRNVMPLNHSLMATWFFCFLIYYLTSQWQFTGMPKWGMKCKINYSRHAQKAG